ncbi:MAG: DUF1365 family protein, partial [Polyangiales bacterium]
MNSALYEGTIRHRRMEPVAHSFAYRIFYAYLDLAELPEALDAVPGWSGRGPALARLDLRRFAIRLPRDDHDDFRGA